jgi:TRAP-type C4-dicarboxylate transport system permease small subunit
VRTTPKYLLWADKQLGRLAGLFAIVGSVAIVGLMMITVIAVAWRYGLNDPIFGIEDLSVITLTFVAAGAVCFGARHNAHVSINIISYFAGRKVTRYTDALMRILVIGIVGLATYGLFTKACGIEKACITSNFSIVHRPYYYVLGLAMGLYGLHVLVQLLISLVHFNGADPTEERD